MTINEIADMVHENAKAKGFHPQDEHPDLFLGNQINNLHCEVSELWEAHRNGIFNVPTDKKIKMLTIGGVTKLMTNAEEEYADIIIRALDQCKRLDIDIEECIMKKHEYNITRPYKHGKRN